MSCATRYSFSKEGYVMIGATRLDDVTDVSISISGGETETSETFAAGDDKVCELDGKSSQIEISVSVECYDANGIDGTSNKFLIGTTAAEGQTITIFPNLQKKIVLDATNEKGMKLVSKNKGLPVAKGFPPATLSMEWKGKFDQEPAEQAVT